MTKVLLVLASVPVVFGCAGDKFEPRVVGAVHASAATYPELLHEGRSQFAAGNAALAVMSFRKALRQEPGSVEARNGLAASYDRLGRFDLSQRYYEEALALRPEDPSLRHNFTVSLRLQGRLGEAESFQLERSAVRAVQEAPALAQRVDTDTVQIATSVIRPRLLRTSLGEVTLITKSEAKLPFQPQRTVQALTRTVRIRVLNAAGKAGVAQRVSTQLSFLGWQNIMFGDAREPRRDSKIVFGEQHREEGESVARALKISARPGPVDGIVVVLGAPQLASQVKSTRRVPS